MTRYYLLDTNIISEFTKPQPNQKVMERLLALENVSAISSITWSELWHGVYLLPESKKRSHYELFLEEKLSEIYPIISLDKNAGKILGLLQTATEKSGKTRSYGDLQIASIAIANNMILVTRNTKDFEHIPNLMMENWFL